MDKVGTSIGAAAAQGIASMRDHPEFNADGWLTLHFQKRVARQGQASQLAAGAEGRLHSDDAHVPPENERPVGAQRQPGAAARAEGWRLIDARVG